MGTSPPAIKPRMYAVDFKRRPGHAFEIECAEIDWDTGRNFVIQARKRPPMLLYKCAARRGPWARSWGEGCLCGRPNAYVRFSGRSDCPTLEAAQDRRHNMPLGPDLLQHRVQPIAQFD